MAKLRGRKQAVTYQLDPRIIVLVNVMAEKLGVSKQVAVEKMIHKGYKALEEEGA